MVIILLHYQVNSFRYISIRIYYLTYVCIVGVDLGILMNLIHKNLKDRSKLAIAEKDYKPASKFISLQSLNFFDNHIYFTD